MVKEVSKQATLFQSWGCKNKTGHDERAARASVSRVPEPRSSTSTAAVSENHVIDLCGSFEGDDEDDELLMNAEETLTTSFGNKSNNNESTSSINNVSCNNAEDDVCNISVGADGFTQNESQCSQLNGFDRCAGKIWIYPTNYPVRDYQFNIVQQVLFKNTMVTLPTGLGKTFIGAVVMYNFYRWYPQGKVIFMAPTKPLVAQQIEACYNIMGIPQDHTAEMTGSMGPGKREHAWQDKRVFFLTPQVLTNDLSRGSCPAQYVKCLVIDEAHKALGNHAYCQVVRELIKYTEKFRVLALSATPGSDIKAVQQVLSNLLISHIEIRTEESIDIKQYSHERTVDKVVVPLGDELSKIVVKYTNIMDVVVRKLKAHGVLYNRDTTSFSKFLILKAREAFRQNPPEKLQRHQFGAVEGDFALALSLYHGYELLQLHGSRSLHNFLSGIVSGEKSYGRTRAELSRNADFTELMQMLADKFKTPEDLTVSQVAGKPFVTGHPKMDKLQEIVLKHFTECADGATRVMIFSQYRDSVQEITDMLAKHSPRLKVMSFIGQATAGKTTKGFTQKEQLKVMKAFREGGYNTLVSTCVGEEGLDIGDVDLIICFDAHKSPIRLVQRMGRTGRKRKGRIVMLVTQGKEEQIYNQSQYSKKRIHKAILDSARQLHFYQHSPLMMPAHYKPSCHKMHITVKESFKPTKKLTTSTGKEAKQSRITTAFNEGGGSKDQSEEIISLEEYRELEAWLVPEHDIPKLPALHNIVCVENNEEQNNQTSGELLSLDGWTPWQNTLQETSQIGHGLASKHLVEIIEFIQLQQSLDAGDDPYGLEMAAYLNEEDIMSANDATHPRGSILNYCLPKQTMESAAVQPISTRSVPKKKAGSCKARLSDALSKFQETVDQVHHTVDSDDDLPAFNVTGNSRKRQVNVDDNGSTRNTEFASQCDDDLPPFTVSDNHTNMGLPPFAVSDSHSNMGLPPFTHTNTTATMETDNDGLDVTEISDDDQDISEAHLPQDTGRSKSGVGDDTGKKMVVKSKAKSLERRMNEVKLRKRKKSRHCSGHKSVVKLINDSDSSDFDVDGNRDSNTYTAGAAGVNQSSMHNDCHTAWANESLENHTNNVKVHGSNVQTHSSNHITTELTDNDSVFKPIDSELAGLSSCSLGSLSGGGIRIRTPPAIEDAVRLCEALDKQHELPAVDLVDLIHEWHEENATGKYIVYPDGCSSNDVSLLHSQPYLDLVDRNRSVKKMSVPESDLLLQTDFTVNKTGQFLSKLNDVADSFMGKDSLSMDMDSTKMDIYCQTLIEVNAQHRTSHGSIRETSSPVHRRRHEYSESDNDENDQSIKSPNLVNKPENALVDKCVKSPRAARMTEAVGRKFTNGNIGTNTNGEVQNIAELQDNGEVQQAEEWFDTGSFDLDLHNQVPDNRLDSSDDAEIGTACPIAPEQVETAECEHVTNSMSDELSDTGCDVGNEGVFTNRDTYPKQKLSSNASCVKTNRSDIENTKISADRKTSKLRRNSSEYHSKSVNKPEKSLLPIPDDADMCSSNESDVILDENAAMPIPFKNTEAEVDSPTKPVAAANRRNSVHGKQNSMIDRQISSLSDDMDNDDDIFANIKTPAQTTKQSLNMDDNDDIFAHIKTPASVTKPSLNMDDDDDDIFANIKTPTIRAAPAMKPSLNTSTQITFTQALNFVHCSASGSESHESNTSHFDNHANNRVSQHRRITGASSHALAWMGEDHEGVNLGEIGEATDVVNEFMSGSDDESDHRRNSSKSHSESLKKPEKTLLPIPDYSDRHTDNDTGCDNSETGDNGNHGRQIKSGNLRRKDKQRSDKIMELSSNIEKQQEFNELYQENHENIEVCNNIDKQQDCTEQDQENHETETSESSDNYKVNSPEHFIEAKTEGGEDVIVPMFDLGFDIDDDIIPPSPEHSQFQKTSSVRLSQAFNLTGRLSQSKCATSHKTDTNAAIVEKSDWSSQAFNLTGRLSQTKCATTNKPNNDTVIVEKSDIDKGEGAVRKSEVENTNNPILHSRPVKHTSIFKSKKALNLGESKSVNKDICDQFEEESQSILDNFTFHQNNSVGIVTSKEKVADKVTKNVGRELDVIPEYEPLSPVFRSTQSSGKNKDKGEREKSLQKQKAKLVTDSQTVRTVYKHAQTSEMNVDEAPVENTDFEDVETSFNLLGAGMLDEWLDSGVVQADERPDNFNNGKPNPATATDDDDVVLTQHSEHTQVKTQVAAVAPFICSQDLIQPECNSTASRANHSSLKSQKSKLPCRQSMFTVTDLSPDFFDDDDSFVFNSTGGEATTISTCTRTPINITKFAKHNTSTPVGSTSVRKVQCVKPFHPDEATPIGKTSDRNSSSPVHYITLSPRVSEEEIEDITDNEHVGASEIEQNQNSHISFKRLGDTACSSLKKTSPSSHSSNKGVVDITNDHVPMLHDISSDDDSFVVVKKKKKVAVLTSPASQIPVSTRPKSPNYAANESDVGSTKSERNKVTKKRLTVIPSDEEDNDDFDDGFMLTQNNYMPAPNNQKKRRPWNLEISNNDSDGDFEEGNMTANLQRRSLNLELTNNDSDDDFEDSVIKVPGKRSLERSKHVPNFGQESRPTKLMSSKQMKPKRKRPSNPFLEDEADLSAGSGEEGASSDEEEGSDLDQYDNSFIQDSQQSQAMNNTDIQALYLKSVRSPLGNRQGFKLQYNHGNMDVYSQVPQAQESGYMEDSFCVGSGSEDDDWMLQENTEDLPREVTVLHDDNSVLQTGRRRRRQGATSFLTSRQKEIHEGRMKALNKIRSKLSKGPSVPAVPSASRKRNRSRSPTDQGRRKSPSEVSHKRNRIRDLDSSSEDEQMKLPFNNKSVIGSNVPVAGKKKARIILSSDDSESENVQPVNKYQATANHGRPGSGDDCLTKIKAKNTNVNETGAASSIDHKKTTTPSTSHTNTLPPVLHKKTSPSYVHIDTGLNMHKPSSTSHSGRPVILVNSAEINGSQDIISDLRFKHNIQVTVAQLRSCDFIVSKRMAVNRTHWSQFSNGTNSASLVSRVQDLRELYDKPCLIVESDTVKSGEEKSARPVHYTKYVHKTTASLLKLNVRVLYTENYQETAQLLADLCQLEQRKQMAITLPVTSIMQQTDKMTFFLNLPRLSYIQALHLCHTYRSVSEFLTSTVSQIAQNGLMSTDRASQLHKFIRRKFDSNMLPTSYN